MIRSFDVHSAAPAAGQAPAWPAAWKMTGPDGSVPIAKLAVVPLTSVAVRTTACSELGALADTTRHPTPGGGTVTFDDSDATSLCWSMHPVSPAATTTSNAPSQ